MSQQVDGPCRTFTAGAALAPFLRVKLSAGVLALAGASDIAIGTLEARSYASGDQVAVRLRNAQGTRKMVAAAAFAAGAELFAAANGTIDDAGTILYGTALEAATNAGDVVEVLPYAIAVQQIEA